MLLSSEIVKDNPVTSSDIKTQYKNDKILLEVMSWVKDGKRPAYINPRKCHEELHHYWCNFNLLRIKNGLLQIKRVDPNDKAKNYFATIVQRPEMGCHERSRAKNRKLLHRISNRIQWNGSRTSKYIINL